MSSILKAMKAAVNPLWKGPYDDGITQSLLGKFLVCRERFRLQVIEGLAPTDKFNHRIEYGNLWHICEEYYAEELDWEPPLKEEAQKLAEKYPTDRDNVEHWYRVCKIQFPIYADYWRKHPDVKNRSPLLQEEVFRVPVTLPSGRVVTMTGKWDSVDLVGKTSIFLQENKSKGDIDQEALGKQLTFDLQTGFYLLALQEAIEKGLIEVPPRAKLRGVRYNVIRRPLSGGRHSISQKKPSKSNPEGETKGQFYGRLGECIRGEPEYFFMRWKVEMTDEDLEKFWTMFLMPVLEQLCDWWDYITTEVDPFDPWKGPRPDLHYRYPYGVYNPMDQGRMGDLDHYLITGNRVGLSRVETLFPEL